MAIAHNQQRCFLALWRALPPFDRRLPDRLKELLADRRFGSRDRRLYRELLFTALRLHRVLTDQDDETLVALVASHCADTPDTRAFRETFARTDLPAPATADLLPDWIEGPDFMGALSASAAQLLRRAPLWIRLQTDDTSPLLREFSERSWTPAPSPVLPTAWKLPPDASVASTDAYREGLVEIQDLGSQLLLETLPGPLAGCWLDACAGAGGKTLQLARLLGAAGQVDAHDIRPAALTELRVRAGRARLRNVRTVTSPAGPYDGVLVDAPCSGTGTWRRQPHLMACTTPADILAAAQLQQTLLADFSRHVRPGGLLVYATCSLCARENEQVCAGFLRDHGDRFSSMPPARDFGGRRDTTGLTLPPEVHDTDGFYVAAFRRHG